jgi:competence protein ComQ
MYNKRAADSLIRVIENQLKIYFVSDSMATIINRQLKVSTGGLFKNNPPVLLMLPITIYQALTGKYKLALRPTASLIFFKAAADIFDDVEDEDDPDSLASAVGKPLANNIATSLLILAESSLLYQSNVKDSVNLQISRRINYAYTRACLGQHLDLSSHSNIDVTEDEYLNITALKSAIITECAVTTGAILAEVTPVVLESFTRFGYYLGMAAQINNDLKGILDGSDLKSKNITLPLIFALRESNVTTRNNLKEYFISDSKFETTEPIKKLLFSCGAIQYSIFKRELFKQSAIEYLEKAKLNNTTFKKLSSLI